MIATWMMYHMAVVALLGLAATLFEEVVQRYQIPSRWIWAGALLGSVGVPAALTVFRSLAPVGSAMGSVGLGRITVISDPAIGSGGAGSFAEAGGTGLGGLDLPLLVIWGAGSALLLGYFGFSMLRLARARREWTPAEMHGEEVLLARNSGPAVVGVRNPRIVIPRWALDLPGDEQRMMLAHEREHVLAGDTRLLVAGYATVVALPWNLPLWFIARRLRDAIEFDCDRRVLRQHGNIAAYGLLLLAVGGRAPGLPVGVAAFSRGKTQLERRVRIMTRLAGRYRTGAALIGALAALALIMVACSVEPPAQSAGTSEQGEVAPPPEPGGASTVDDLPIRSLTVSEPQRTVEPESRPEAPRENVSTPTAPGNRSAQTANVASGAPTADASNEEPAFVPMEVRPTLRNARALGETLQREYPSLLKDAGVEGTTTLWVRIDTDGQVDDVRVFDSSGYPQFDQVAINTMREVADFTPAQNRDQPVGVWIQIPVVFQIAH